MGQGHPVRKSFFPPARLDSRKIPCRGGPGAAFWVCPMTIIEELKWRGLVADCTDLDALTRRSASGPLTLYCGFDPTGDSLHVGSLMGQLTLRRFQLLGHHPIALAGGATGMIGDPSGKSAERNLLSREQLDANLASIKAQLSRILDFDSKANPARMVDNASWTAGRRLPRLPARHRQALFGQRDGRQGERPRRGWRARAGSATRSSATWCFRPMISTTSARPSAASSRSAAPTSGATSRPAPTSSAGSWASPSWGLTFPLITKSDGTKFGKTESGAVWLDPRKTSPYRFYQFFINTEDSDGGRLPEEVHAAAGRRDRRPRGARTPPTRAPARPTGRSPAR